MRKVRYSIIVLAIIIVLIFISMRAAGLSFSQENVHKALERSQHFGPSDEILLKYTGKDGKGIVIGKCGDEGLSVTHTKRYLGVLYKVDTDVLTGIDMSEPSSFIPCEKEISIFYSPDKDLVYGICYEDSTKEIKLEMGTWNEIYFAEDIALNESGFFCIKNVSSLYSKEIEEGKEAPYYIYAESKAPSEGTYLKVSSNLTKGQIISREELDKMIPEKDKFMPPELMKNIMNFNGDELNRINAGIKKYTGIDFCANAGWADGETIRLSYEPRIWYEQELTLTFVKKGDRFIPRTTDENMDTAAISWLKSNYSKSYEVNNITSAKVNVTEKDGKKQYWTMLGCDLRLIRSNKVGANDDIEKTYGRTDAMNVEVIVEADLNDPARPWKLYYDDGLTGKLRDIEELNLGSIYDLSVDQLMSTITGNRIRDLYADTDPETIADILNNAAGKTVSEEEGKANKLDPDHLDYDSRPWECEFYLIDYDEDEGVVARNSVKPGTLTLYCNWYSDLVCVIVEDHNDNRKVEYYNDKDLYEFVRHSGDLDGNVDEETYKKYKKWFDKAEASSLKDLESGFGWTGKYDLIKFEKQWEFDSSDGKGTIEIYAFEYAFTLDDFSKHNGGAGGMHLDGDKRVVMINPMSGQLAFKVVDGEAVDVLYIGNDWGVDLDPDNNDEESIKNQKQEVERLLKQDSEEGTW